MYTTSRRLWISLVKATRWCHGYACNESLRVKLIGHHVLYLYCHITHWGIFTFKLLEFKVQSPDKMYTYICTHNLCMYVCSCGWWMHDYSVFAARGAGLSSMLSITPMWKRGISGRGLKLVRSAHTDVWGMYGTVHVFDTVNSPTLCLSTEGHSTAV